MKGTDLKGLGMGVKMADVEGVERFTKKSLVFGGSALISSYSVVAVASCNYIIQISL